MAGSRDTSNSITDLEALIIRDHATLDTLKRGKGSDSTDLGGVSRITPLLLVSKTEVHFNFRQG